MTREQVKKQFEERGERYSEWAKANNFNPKTVVAVVNGFNKGRSGEAHKVAVALGIKSGEAA